MSAPFWALILLAPLCAGLAASGKNWAVLVAGSNGWGNYRHQADVCHAFQILHGIGGIPKENIIVMMADDIAENEENPFKGNIINYPNGPNVYPGVNKNYTSETVTAKNFLKVLKELPSTSDDNIFIYFTDHGAQGLVAMPFGDPLYADEFNSALREMHKRNQYNEMVIYVEACESGSMFDGLLKDNLNIYATTASDDTHSSYAYFFDEKRGVYLADLYSIMWMQDSQYNMTSGESLLTQFQLVKAETNESTVEAFGDLKIQAEQVENFQANGFFGLRTPRQRSVARRGRRKQHLEEAVKAFVKNPKRKIHQPRFLANKSMKDPSKNHFYAPVDSRDIVLSTLRMRLKVAEFGVDEIATKELTKAIAKEEKYRVEVADRFQEIIEKTVYSDNRYPVLPIDLAFWLSMDTQLTDSSDYDCLRMLYQAYQASCFDGFEDYSFKFVKVLANLCQIYARSASIGGIITESCQADLTQGF